VAPQHPFQSRLAWGLYYGTIPKGYRAEKEDADPVGLEWDKCVVADDDGEERSPANDMGVPDDLWGQILPVILEMDPPKTTGRKGVHLGRILDGTMFRC
jgi:hypothetical protein